MSKIVIIGGGMAGLSAGIYARLAGFEAEIYERNTVAGGNCSGWRRGDYYIDNCIHWMTGTKKGTPMRKVWEEVGALTEDFELIQRESFYVCEDGDKQITLWRDPERTRAEMLALSPEDEREINRFIDYVKIAETLQEPAENALDVVNYFKELNLTISRREMVSALFEYLGLSLKTLAERFKHPLLQHLFTDFMAKEYEAYWLILAYAFFTSGNGDLPVGGSMGVVNRMVERYEKLGGKLYLGKDVKLIIMDKQKFKINTNVFDKKSSDFTRIKKIVTRYATGIELADGSVVTGDYFICACDVPHTFRVLLQKKHTPKPVKREYKDKKHNPVYSSFQVAFAVDDLVEKVNDTLYMPCEPIDVGYQQVDRICVKNYRVYGEFIAPEGHTVLQVSIVQYRKDFDYWEKLYKDKAAYNMTKRNIAEAVRYRIEQKFPELTDRIRILDVWTPETYARRNNCFKGAYMRFITTATNRSAFLSNDVHGVGNVFLASHWLRYPGGIPMAATMGKMAVKKIAGHRQQQAELDKNREAQEQQKQN